MPDPAKLTADPRFPTVGFMCGRGMCLPLYPENEHPATTGEIIAALSAGADLLALSGDKRGAAILRLIAEAEGM